MATCQHLTTTTQVLDALGGHRSVATMTGKRPKAVWDWYKDPTFPSKFYVVMTAELAAKGFSAPPSLWGMAEGPAPEPTHEKEPAHG